MEIGDTVTLKPGSRFYVQNSVINPADMEGIITCMDDPRNDPELPINVRWDNGYPNCYAEDDLILVETEEDKMDTAAMYEHPTKGVAICGHTTLKKADRRRGGHTQYIIKYSSSSQSLGSVRHADIPQLVAALLDAYDGNL